MATSSLDSPPASPMRHRRGGFIRRCERSCWAFVTRLPLAIVYGLTTWAVYVAADLSIRWTAISWIGVAYFVLAAVLYFLLNWSYTVSVFTDPGSPSNLPPSLSLTASSYSPLPLHEPENQPELPAFTVKASGGARYCKKCRTKKPDRAHHCSTCNACRLKMDHHCPWLATCVGLRNYKPFVLFCAYTTFFCYACFVISAAFLWSELGTLEFVNSGGLMGVNVVLLAILSGIIGIVLTGFTGWHLSLAARNQTTIECLEKTRYLSPLRRNAQRRGVLMDRDGGESVNLLQRYGQQLTEIHTNALPGVTRPEEGEERPSPDLNDRITPDGPPLSAAASLRQNYESLERQRERQRYEEYLDEKDSEKLPHAFDLGWRHNLRAVFGPAPWLWVLPIPNSLGDGWHWEPSARWLAARDRLRQERDRTRHEQARREHEAGWGRPSSAVTHSLSTASEDDDGERHYLTTSEGVATVSAGRRSPSKADQVLGRSSGQYADEGFNEPRARPGSGFSLQTLKPSSTEADDTASTDGLYSDDDRHDIDTSLDRLRSRRKTFGG